MRNLAFVLLAPLLANAYQYTVGVGKDETTGKVGLGFDPSSIRPAAGDTIVFVFQAGTHSVIQTTFDNPCVPSAGGYTSGDQTVAQGTPVDADGLPTSTFTVNSVDPMYFYDGAPGECTKGGVFTVNPPLSGSGTAADFLTNAKNANPATATTAPTSTSSAAATGSATSGTPSPTASSPSAGFASAGVEAVVLAGFVALSIGSALL